MEDVIVTTGRSVSSASEKLAQQTAAKIGCRFIDRQELSLPVLRQQYKAQQVIVANQGRLMLHTPEGELFFHPSMAHLRVKNLRHGLSDHMAAAMGLRPGMWVLDCTLGLGADAIVASFVVGESGHVIGLESSPCVAAVIGQGLAQVAAENIPIQEAMRRITVINQEHLAYMRSLPDKSVDVVYFDPMFRHPLRNSASMEPLRQVADYSPVNEEDIREACRVARGRVVLKENSRSQEFARLGFSRVEGGKYSPVHYGIIDV